MTRSLKHTSREKDLKRASCKFNITWGMWQWNTISVQAAAAATGCSQSNRLRLREYYAHITSESQTHWQTEARQARLMKSEEKKAGAIELERYTPISPFCITCFCTIRPHRQGHFMAWKRGIDEFIWVNKKKKKEKRVSGGVNVKSFVTRLIHATPSSTRHTKEPGQKKLSIQTGAPSVAPDTWET